MSGAFLIVLLYASALQHILVKTINRRIRSVTVFLPRAKDATAATTAKMNFPILVC